MEFRGHNDDSDGDDFLPHHRRLGLGRLYQEGELGDMPPSSSVATPSLNFNQSGFFASGSAFRRPPIFPSPLSSTAQLPPSATPPSPHRQPPLSHQPQPLLISQGGGRGSALVDGDNSQKPAPPVQLPSSLDPNLSLVQDRTQEQQQQLREACKDHRDAVSPRSFPATDGPPPAEGGGGLPSSSKTDAAAAPMTTSRTRPSRAVASGNTGASARYRECLKNHAARVGGHVLDGCGEFMPGGEDGTSEALKCAACTCHRSFHRKEVEGGEESEGLFIPVSSASPSRSVQHGDPRRYYVPDIGAGNGAYPGGVARGGGLSSGGARNLHNPSPLSLQTPSNRGRQWEHPTEGLLPPSLGGAFAPPRSGGTAFGGGGGGGNDDDENTNYSGGTTTTESSSEEMQAHMLAVAATSFHHGAPPAPALQTPPPAGAGASKQQHAHYQVAGASGWTKKRFRTKFSAEQKEMMAEFAERVGWRMQKQDDAAVEEFCREAGVSRRVFKVWMHNNKHALLKSKQQQPPSPPPPPPQGVPRPQPQPQPQQSSSSS